MDEYNKHLRSLIEQHEKDARAINKVSKNKESEYSLSSYIKNELGVASINDESESVHIQNQEIRSISGENANGVWVSLATLAKRDLNSSDLSEGGYLSNNNHDGGLIELLRPYSAVLGAGATLITGLKQGSLILPRISSSVTATWVGEGQPAPLSEQSFDQVVIAPKTLSVNIRITRQLLRDSSIRGGIEGALRRDILNAIMQEIDSVAINGVGSETIPLGILNNTDIPVIGAGANGAAPSWGLLTDMENAIDNQNNNQNIGFVTNSSVRKKLRNTQKGANLDFIWTDNESVMGRTAKVSNNVPSNLSKGTSEENCSALIMGDWSDCFVGMWGPAAVDIIVDKYSYAKNGIVSITALADIGVGIRHPASFSICKDILTN